MNLVTIFITVIVMMTLIGVGSRLAIQGEPNYMLNQSWDNLNASKSLSAAYLSSNKTVERIAFRVSDTFGFVLFEGSRGLVSYGYDNHEKGFAEWLDYLPTVMKVVAVLLVLPALPPIIAIVVILSIGLYKLYRYILRKYRERLGIPN